MTSRHAWTSIPTMTATGARWNRSISINLNIFLPDGESEEEDQELSPPVPFDSQAISDVIPGSASVTELSLALVELQRKFKISVDAMDRVAELVQIATGENSRSPSFAKARALEEESDIDFRVVDCCVNDDCVFENAPSYCDQNGFRQQGHLHKCPYCESRHVLVGPDEGKE